MSYYDTYYFLNIIQSVLDNTFPYLANLENFFGNDEYTKFIDPFPKDSALHKFISFLITMVYYETIDDVAVDSLVNKEDTKLWVDASLENYRISWIGFRNWLKENEIKLDSISEDTLVDYHDFLYEKGIMQALLNLITEEIFFIMFLNRGSLRTFNQLISDRILDIDFENLPKQYHDRFSSNGKIKRTNIPSWARKAVFFRDRGQCSICKKDISGLINIDNEENYDHIVPLTLGGINDITNLQLLCKECNQKKGGKHTDTSTAYEAWY